MEKNRIIEFLTNNFELPAETVALHYKYRWDIGLYFRWIKQHLKITKFYGTSANAVMIQVYTAVVTFCAIAQVADEYKFEGSLYELSSLLSTTLTERIPLPDLLKRFHDEIETNYQNDMLSLF